MLEDKNFWRNKYNPSSLEGEDWLEPSDKLFDALESDIYGLPEKENKKVLAYWLSGLLILLLLIGFVLTRSGQVDVFTQEIDAKGEIGLNSVNSVTSLDQKNTNPKPVFEEIPNALSSITSSTSTKANQSGLEVRNTKSQKRDNYAQLKTTSELSTAKQNSISGIVSKIRSTGLSVSNTTSRQSVNNAIIKNIQSTPHASAMMASGAVDNIATLFPLQSKVYPLTLDKDNFPLELNSGLTPIDVTAPSNRLGKAFYVGLHGTQSSYKLNENFATAVSPADFSHTTGQGLSLNVGFEKNISPRFLYYLQGGLQRTAFTSGHNSSYTYGENNQSERVNLTMATPLGFVEGSTLIQRESTTPAAAQELTLNLLNKHIYNTASLEVGVGYNILAASDYDLSARIGLGMQQLFGLSNALNEVNSSDPGYTASDNDIISDQTTINKLLPQASFGVLLNRNIADRYYLGVGYDVHAGLKPLHAEGSLSTELFAQSFYLRISRRF